MRQTDQSPPEVTPVFNTGKATRTVYDRLKGDHLWLSDKKKNHVTQNVKYFSQLGAEPQDASQSSAFLDQRHIPFDLRLVRDREVGQVRFLGHRRAAWPGAIYRLLAHTISGFANVR